MAKGSGVVFKSWLKEVEKDINKSKRTKLGKAARHLVAVAKRKIRTRGVSAPGSPPGRGPNRNLIKGIGYKLINNDLVIVGAARPGYHFHLLELGTKARFKKDGKSTGKIEERPFLKPTFKEEADRVETILSQEWL